MDRKRMCFRFFRKRFLFLIMHQKPYFVKKFTVKGVIFIINFFKKAKK